MPDRYVYHAASGSPNDGTSWVCAYQKAIDVAAVDLAGDRIFFSQAHDESTAGHVTLNMAGTAASPSQLLCVNDAAFPPTALATGAIIKSSGDANVVLNGVHYCYGLTLHAGVGATGGSYIILSNDVGSQAQVYERCSFITGTSNNSGSIYAGVSGGGRQGRCDFIDCSFKVSQDTHGIGVFSPVYIRGGNILSGSVVFDQGFIAGGTAYAECHVDGFDFTNAPAGSHLCAVSHGLVVFRNCKLPPSWTGRLVKTAASIGPSGRAEMWNCDNADTNYRMWIDAYCGSIKSETTLVKTGGASDGDTPLSWVVETNANPEYPTHALRLPEIFSERITAVGSAKTITVDIAHNLAAPLKDDEIWVEVQYLGQPGSPQQKLPGTHIDDAKADVFATGVDQATSSATWADGSPPTSTKQKLEVTFTPQAAGVAIVTVCVAKASATIYVDPVAQIT